MMAELAPGHRSTDRRTVLKGATGAVVLGALAACTSSTDHGGARTSAAVSGPSGTRYVGDLRVVAVAAALENLTVIAYRGALTKASRGQLGTVAPAVSAFFAAAMDQHSDHAAAWNRILTRAGTSAVSGAPLSITKEQITMLNAASSVRDVAELALALESAAAQTYTLTVGTVTDADAIMTAARIQPVEAMHAAILGFLLGRDPVPVSFLGIHDAIPASALTA